MTSQVWMIAITVIYVLAMMALSWYIGKKTTKDETEFMVGGREFTPQLAMVLF
jgi:SSS family solute:Na+ symporter